jgi:hypothetical protein
MGRPGLKSQRNREVDVAGEEQMVSSDGRATVEPMKVRSHWRRPEGGGNNLFEVGAVGVPEGPSCRT